MTMITPPQHGTPAMTTACLRADNPHSGGHDGCEKVWRYQYTEGGKVFAPSGPCSCPCGHGAKMNEASGEAGSKPQSKDSSIEAPKV